MQIILLVGAPGSGKSTQGAALMKQNPRFIHLSLGDVVRKRLNDPTDRITLDYHHVIKEGKLLPDSLILEILQNELENIQEQDSIVLLDGYPRTREQYEQFKANWGLPASLIHLNVAETELNNRLQHRGQARIDDNAPAIAGRLAFYQSTTAPLIEMIKQELGNKAITINPMESIPATGLYLYAQLQRVPEVHAVLQKTVAQAPSSLISPTIQPASLFSIIRHVNTSIFTCLWRPTNEYPIIKALQDSYQTTNFSFSILGRRTVYLETPAEIKQILHARSHLGHVYRHFSMAAGLRHDFVATDAHDPKDFWYQDNQVNIWKLIHEGFGQVVKTDRQRITFLIKKHLHERFFAEKTFDLDTAFDEFFCAFWSEYLFGNKVSVDHYMQNRELLLHVMKQGFYNNYFKSLDPTGLSSLLYAQPVHHELELAKEQIKNFIDHATPDSFVTRFQDVLTKLNELHDLGLNKESIAEIVADNVFDLFFEPDFLETVMYEALVATIRDNADLHNPEERKQVYSEGLQQGFLFPIRSRVLEEAVTLTDGSVLPPGTQVYFNLKKAGIYHSTGPRQCVGITFTHNFREELFKQLQPIAFKVQSISYPPERLNQTGNENVPVSPERYRVSWTLKRDEAMRHLAWHNYRGQKFFDVLSLHENADLNAHIVKQLTLKITRFLQKNTVDQSNVVIVTAEVRGIPVAAQVADRLRLPLYTIRKKGGYKMLPDDLRQEAFSKGYGDPDIVELPLKKIEALAGKKIIFIDDGLASGQSALACIRLLEQAFNTNLEPAQVLMVMAMLKHDYAQVDPKLSEHRLVKTLFDCHGGPVEPTPTCSSSSSCPG